MNVLMVEPGIAPYEKEVNGLQEIQDAVGGGLFDVIYPFQDRVGIVCNDESLLRGMEFNRSMPGGYGGVFGPFFVCGLGEEDLCSLTPELMDKYKKYFHNAEILLGVRGNEPVTLKVQPKPHKAPDAPAKSPKAPER